MARLSNDQVRLEGAAWAAPSAAGEADAHSSASGGHQAAGGRLVPAQAGAGRGFQLLGVGAATDGGGVMGARSS